MKSFTPARLLADICSSPSGYLRRASIDRMGLEAQWALVDLVEMDLVSIVAHQDQRCDVVRPVLTRFGTYQRVPQRVNMHLWHEEAVA